MDIDRLLAETDPARNAPIPGHDSPAARHLLNQVVMSGSPAQHRMSWRPRLIPTAGVLAATAAGAAAIAVVASGSPATVQAARPAPSAGPAITVARVMHSAALAARHMPAGRPRPDQFVYSKIFTTDNGRHAYEEWSSVSGTRFGYVRGGYGIPPGGEQTESCVDGRLKAAPPPSPAVEPGPCTQAESAAYLPGLPTDPAALKGYLEKAFPSVFHPLFAHDETEELLGIAEDMNENYYLTPPQQAALYGLLAQRPDLQLVPRVRDQMGDVGVGIREQFTDKGKHYTLIFNARTYALMGANYSEDAGSVLLEKAVVSKPGQLP
jgi:hypothetical protein